MCAGGVRLASNRGSSSGLDWQDVTQAVVNLQAFIGGEIVLEMLPVMRGGSWDLEIRAHRARPQMGAMGQPLSVSVSATCRALRFVELEAACLSVLHQLDVECYNQGAYVGTEIKA